MPSRVSWGLTFGYALCKFQPMTLNGYLEAKSISGAEFASLVGISEASLSRIRKGEQNITREMMQRIIAASGGKIKADTLVFPPEAA